MSNHTSVHNYDTFALLLLLIDTFPDRSLNNDYTISHCVRLITYYVYTYMLRVQDNTYQGVMYYHVCRDEYCTYTTTRCTATKLDILQHY